MLKLIGWIYVVFWTIINASHVRNKHFHSMTYYSITIVVSLCDFLYIVSWKLYRFLIINNKLLYNKGICAKYWKVSLI